MSQLPTPDGKTDENIKVRLVVKSPSTLTEGQLYSDSSGTNRVEEIKDNKPVSGDNTICETSHVKETKDNKTVSEDSNSSGTRHIQDINDNKSDSKDNGSLETDDNTNVQGSSADDTTNLSNDDQDGPRPKLKTLAQLIFICRDKGLQVYNDTYNIPEKEKSRIEALRVASEMSHRSTDTRRHRSDDRASNRQSRADTSNRDEKSAKSSNIGDDKSDWDGSSTVDRHVTSRRHRLDTGSSWTRSSAISHSRGRPLRSTLASRESDFSQQYAPNDKDIDAEERLQLRIRSRSKRRRTNAALEDILKLKQEQLETTSMKNKSDTPISKQDDSPKEQSLSKDLDIESYPDTKSDARKTSFQKSENGKSITVAPVTSTTTKVERSATPKMEMSSTQKDEMSSTPKLSSKPKFNSDQLTVSTNENKAPMVHENVETQNDVKNGTMSSNALKHNENDTEMPNEIDEYKIKEGNVTLVLYKLKTKSNLDEHTLNKPESVSTKKTEPEAQSSKDINVNDNQHSNTPNDNVNSISSISNCDDISRGDQSAVKMERRSQSPIDQLNSPLNVNARADNVSQGIETDNDNSGGTYIDITRSLVTETQATSDGQRECGNANKHNMGTGTSSAKIGSVSGNSEGNKTVKESTLVSTGNSDSGVETDSESEIDKNNSDKDGEEIRRDSIGTQNDKSETSTSHVEDNKTDNIQTNASTNEQKCVNKSIKLENQESEMNNFDQAVQISKSKDVNGSSFSKDETGKTVKPKKSLGNGFLVSPGYEESQTVKSDNTNRTIQNELNDHDPNENVKRNMKESVKPKNELTENKTKPKTGSTSKQTTPPSSTTSTARKTKNVPNKKGDVKSQRSKKETKDMSYSVDLTPGPSQGTKTASSSGNSQSSSRSSVESAAKMLLMMMRIKQNNDEERVHQENYLREIADVRRSMREDFKNLRLGIEYEHPLEVAGNDQPKTSTEENTIEEQVETNNESFDTVIQEVESAQVINDVENIDENKDKEHDIYDEERYEDLTETDIKPKQTKVKNKSVVKKVDCSWDPDHPLYEEIQSGFKSKAKIPNTKQIQRALKQLKNENFTTGFIPSYNVYIQEAKRLNSKSFQNENKRQSTKNAMKANATNNLRQSNSTHETEISPEHVRKRDKVSKGKTMSQTDSIKHSDRGNDDNDVDIKESIESHNPDTVTESSRKKKHQTKSVDFDEEKLNRDKDIVNMYYKNYINHNELPSIEHKQKSVYKSKSEKRKTALGGDSKLVKSFPNISFNAKDLNQDKRDLRIPQNNHSLQNRSESVPQYINTYSGKNALKSPENSSRGSTDLPISAAVGIVQSRQRFYSEQGGKGKEEMPRDHRVWRIFQELKLARHGRPVEQVSASMTDIDDGFLFINYNYSEANLSEQRSDMELNKFLYDSQKYATCSKGKPLYIAPSRKERALDLLRQRVWVGRQNQPGNVR